ncbi:bacteriocin fulvocin C-related protein [Gynurincola endophyticus]|uniref:bacteriocin fulvocin C-related protein n=1 Tax=Gynurincola endophyticus TaxID=2479004 RepID=UPI000F8EAC54|nr:bacteriocin fulvocin C-related protein [Gynurincola endophyticus]
MKVSSFLYSIFILFALSACTTNKETFDNILHDSNFRKFESIAKMEHRNEKKIAFLMMSPEEKAFVWQANLKLAIENNQFDKNQIELIHEAINFINAHAFETEGSLVNNKNFHIWKYKVTQSFTPIQLSEIFNNISNQPIVILEKNINVKKNDNNTKEYLAVAIKPDCSCSQSSDFCSRYNSQNPDLPPIIFSCQSAAGCNEHSSGCGWLWSQQCDGICEAGVIAPVD